MDNRHQATQLRKQAMAVLNGGDRATAARLFYEATKLTPDHQESWLWLGRTLDNNDHKRQAFEYVLAINPNSNAAQLAREELARLQNPLQTQVLQPSNPGSSDQQIVNVSPQESAPYLPQPQYVPPQPQYTSPPPQYTSPPPQYTSPQPQYTSPPPQPQYVPPQQVVQIVQNNVTQPTLQSPAPPHVIWRITENASGILGLLGGLITIFGLFLPIVVFDVPLLGNLRSFNCFSNELRLFGSTISSMVFFSIFPILFRRYKWFSFTGFISLLTIAAGFVYYENISTNAAGAGDLASAIAIKSLHMQWTTVTILCTGALLYLIAAFLPQLPQPNAKRKDLIIFCFLVFVIICSLRIY